MALSLNIPHDERNSSTPVHSPRFFCLARNFSDRYGSPVGSSPGSHFSSPLKGRSSSPITMKQRSASPFRHLQRFNVSSPRTPTPPLICSPTAVRSNLGANWTRAIVDVYQAQEPDELMEALQEIRSILAAQQKKDHLKFCKKDLEAALNEKKRRIPMLFIPTIRQFVLDLLADFFDQDHVNKLPSAVLTYIFGFLNTAKLGTACAVGRSWNEILRGDAIWKPLYIRRFRFLDPREAIGLRKFKDLYKERLLDPHIGDLVEVAWKGKFRLESLDIYQGLAWWSAIVVEKGDGSKYKIHYPGWDSRWDEWVHRDRLRWTVEHDLEARISPNDDVEIWCCGSNVPGAWLEAKVKRVKGKKYCVGRVTSSGTMWVDRDRVRLSPKWGRNLSSKQPQGFFSANTAASVSSSCSIM